MSKTFEEYRKRRQDRFIDGVDVEKMRLGQQACEVVVLQSDPEIRFALVPLTEGEYRRAIEAAEKLPVGDGMPGNVVRERVQTEMILYFSAREFNNLAVRFFDNEADVMELEHHDINYAWNLYLEMTATISPSLVGMSEDDFEGLKKALPRIEWSGLSGQQWFAAQRFLDSIRPLLLTASLSGSQPTEK